jgi:hypothetical protein
MRHLCLAVVALPCLAQVETLRVVSEFTRIDPFGHIVKQDRGTAAPRHILSPGVPRNAFSSLRIVVTLDKPTKYILDIGQNPENAVKATLYKEKFEKAGEQWIPDGLESVKIPYESTFPDDAAQGQTAITFWLDMWVAKDAPVDRIKVEPQLWVGTSDDWFTYPMEVRVLETVVPNAGDSAAALPAITERSDAAAVRPLRAAYCSTAERLAPPVVNARALIRRNALQTLWLKNPASASHLLKISKQPSIQSWCSARPDPAGPEWFLRFRDLVYQSGGK